MQALRILANCLASGSPLEAGRLYAVPTEVSTADAEVLVRMGRAVEAEIEPRQDLQQEAQKVRRAKR